MFYQRPSFFTFLFIYLCFSPIITQATTYYLAANGSDANSGTSIGTPWRSLSKVQGIRTVLKAGDRVLFRRGDVFPGSINMQVLNSNLDAEPVVFSAYGDESLPLPIITGERALPTDQIQPWETTNIPNVYKKTLTAVFSSRYPAYFSRDGKVLPMGRYPNFNAEDAGGLRIQSTGTVLLNNVNRTEVTDVINLSNPSVLWVGGDFVTMPNTWLYTKGPILAHDPTTGKIAMSLSGYAIVSGKGYFIQNHVNALDLEGEWSYDNTGSGTFYLYSSTPPTNSTFVYSHSAFGIDFSGSTADNFIFENLHFSNYNDACIRLNSNAIGRKIRFLNCQFTNSYDGLFLKANEDVIVKNCTFENIRNNAITIEAKKILLEKNNIRKVAIEPGSGDTFNNGYVGISFVGQNGVCRLNRIDSTGYNGIRFEGQNLLIERNEVSNFTLNKNDGGGIYSFNGFFTPGSTFPNYRYGKNIVRENIVYDGRTNYTLFSFGGTREIGGNRSVGIYSDNNTISNRIENNILYNLNANAILMQTSADSITVQGNVFYKTQTPEMAGLPAYNSNTLNYHTYNTNGEIETGTKKVDILQNTIVENYPIQNNWRYKPAREGLAEKNSYFRFDYNQKDILFNYTSETGTVDISLENVQKNYAEDLGSLLIPIQPSLKNVQLGSELLQNTDFTTPSLIAPWTITRQLTNGTLKQLTTSGVMDGGYLESNITGGSFTAINRYFLLEQAVTVEKDKIYRLKFSYYSNQTPESAEKNISILLGNSPNFVTSTPNTRKELEFHLIPTQSGQTKLSIKVSVPYANIKYFFDNFSLREIQNYSAKQEDYEIFHVNRTETDEIVSLPTLPTGWYYVNPANHSFVSGNVTVKPFTALYLIKTNRVRPSKKTLSPLFR